MTRSSSSSLLDLDAALDLVVPRHHAALRVAKAQHRLHAGGHGRQRLAGLGAPGAVVARLLLGGHLALAQRVELGHAHVAGVDVAGGLQLGQHLAVAVHALHLVERALVVIEAEPGHAFEDDVDGGLGGALQVGVLDAQDEVAALRAREGPGVQRRADVAQVDEAGGRRGEARAHTRGHGRVVSHSGLWRPSGSANSYDFYSVQDRS
jgi:hypothetical protein